MMSMKTVKLTSDDAEDDEVNGNVETDRWRCWRWQQWLWQLKLTGDDAEDGVDDYDDAQDDLVQGNVQTNLWWSWK